MVAVGLEMVEVAKFILINVCDAVATAAAADLGHSLLTVNLFWACEHMRAMIETKVETVIKAITIVHVLPEE